MTTDTTAADPFSSTKSRAIAGHDGAPLISDAGAFVRICLNRPREHNRLDPADIDALHPLLRDIAQDRRIRSILITGSGDRSFSSGYTLGAIASELDQRFENMLDQLENLPQVTVIAFNGSVYGGATDLALCVDIRLGFHGMRMFMPAAKFGMHYYPGGMRRYVNKLGLSAATKLFLTAMTVESDEMLRIGFLTELSAREAVTQRAHEYLAAIGLTEATVVGQMKVGLRAIAERSADYEQLAKIYQASLSSPELKRRLVNLLNG
jgi:enoyl-CoA hydratase/carnithine racemase